MCAKDHVTPEVTTVLPPKPNIQLEEDEDWFFCYHEKCKTWRIYTKGSPKIYMICRLRDIKTQLIVVSGQVFSADDTEHIVANTQELYNEYEAGT